MTTCAPCAASATAVSKPMPALAPVMSATLPSSAVTSDHARAPSRSARESRAEIGRTARASGLGALLGARRSVVPRLLAHPRDQLVAVEPDLAAAGEAMGRDAV